MVWIYPSRRPKKSSASAATVRREGIDGRGWSNNFADHFGTIHKRRDARVAHTRHATPAAAALALIPRYPRMVFADRAFTAADFAIGHAAISFRSIEKSRSLPSTRTRARRGLRPAVLPRSVVTISKRWEASRRPASPVLIAQNVTQTQAADPSDGERAYCRFLFHVVHPLRIISR
jgi:hypothetical protein